jgi:hypothetical protein
VCLAQPGEIGLAEKLTAADKDGIKDELVRELEKKIDSIAAQATRVGPTLTPENRLTYEASVDESIRRLRNQMSRLQADRFRPFAAEEPIAHGALVKARFEPAGRPHTESWILVVAGVSEDGLAYKGHEISVGEGSFGYGGSLLGLRAGESRQVYGEGRSIPDYYVEVLAVL